MPDHIALGLGRYRCMNSADVPYETPPDHERDGRLLLLREGQELRSEIATDVAVEGHVISDPETVEDREQQQRVFDRSPALPLVR